MSGSNDSPWRRKLPVGCLAGRTEEIAFGLAGGLEQRVKACLLPQPRASLVGRALPVLRSMSYLSVRRNASKPREILQ